MQLRIAVWFSAAVLGAQLQEPPRPAVFRGGTDYVRLDVVVTDGRDRPVEDLKADELEVVQAGVTQRIATLQFVQIPPARRVFDPSPNAPIVDVALNVRPPASRRFVLLIDDFNILETSLPNTKAVVRDFLQEVSSVDQVAVVFAGRSDLSIDFTSDINVLGRAVDRIRSALGHATDAAPTAVFDPNVSRGDTMPLDSDPTTRRRNSMATLDVLGRLCTTLESSPESRRAIVVVSEGLTHDLSGTGDVDSNDVMLELKQVFERARRTGVPIYTLDPRGTVTPELAVRGALRDARAVAANVSRQQGFLRNVADTTGGLAMVNRSDLARGVVEIVDDNGSYYVIGFYPAPLVRDGKFHDVQVRVTRPGLRVRARPGYVAPPATEVARTVDQQLNNALREATPATGLTLRAFGAAVRPAGNSMSTAVAVEVEYPLQREGTRRLDDELVFKLLALDHDGKLKGSSARKLRVGATPPATGNAIFVIDEVLSLPKGPLTLRIGVASSRLGLVGTVMLPVEIGDPNASKLQMSALVLGLVGEKREATLRGDAFAGLLPFQPVLNRTFRAGDTLRVFAPLTWSASAAPHASITATLRGDDIVAVRETTIESSLHGRQRQATFAVDWPLRVLTPGRYTLVVEAWVGRDAPITRAVSIDVR